mgnify:CR=1 FL=1
MNCLVLGGGGFIGNHLVNELKQGSHTVTAADLKFPEFEDAKADRFIQGDLRDPRFVDDVIDQRYDRIYQLAADMGGAGFVFTGENDADILHNSAAINLNVLDSVRRQGVGVIFYSSSACMYPERNQETPDAPVTAESSAYPAAPDSEYGWEKLFSERLYLAYARNYGINVRIARFHNIFGEKGSWTGGREKAPAAICRKIAEAEPNGEIEIWGDGLQTRSFLHVTECLEGVERLIESDFQGPVNIGSEEMISINDFAKLVMSVAGKEVSLNHIDGPLGVRGRNSDNRLIEEKLGWKPKKPLRWGVERTYAWIEQQVKQAATEPA